MEENRDMAIQAGEEFLIGLVPDADMTCEELESGSFDTPAWSELVDVVQAHKMHTLEIVFMGCIYESDSHKAGAANGWSGVVTANDITRAPFASAQLMKEQGQVMPEVGKGFVKQMQSIAPEVNTPIFAHRLSQGAIDIEGTIVGIVVRKLG